MWFPKTNAGLFLRKNELTVSSWHELVILLFLLLECSLFFKTEHISDQQCNFLLIYISNIKYCTHHWQNFLVQHTNSCLVYNCQIMNIMSFIFNFQALNTVNSMYTNSKLINYCFENTILAYTVGCMSPYTLPSLFMCVCWCLIVLKIPSVLFVTHPLSWRTRWPGGPTHQS